MTAKDFVRSEGVYVSTSIYPEHTHNAAVLFKIERVNGDCSVTSLECTIDEMRDLIEQANVLLPKF
jgi:hypothetical protein